MDAVVGGKSSLQFARVAAPQDMAGGNAGQRHLDIPDQDGILGDARDGGLVVFEPAQVGGETVGEIGVMEAFGFVHLIAIS